MKSAAYDRLSHFQLIFFFFLITLSLSLQEEE